MDIEAKLRPIYLIKILKDKTDEEHFLSTAQLCQILQEQYGIETHRVTIKRDIELLQQAGIGIQSVRSTQNLYNYIDRDFDVAELKLLIDAVVSSKFITQSKSEDLAAKLSALAGEYRSSELKRNMNCEGRIKLGNEKIYFIVDTINEAINAGKKISFQYFNYNVRKEKKLKKDGEPFVITPLHLIWNGDYYYMIGVYEYKQRLGSFRVDRIAKCPTILDEAGTPAPDDFDISTYLNTTFRMFNSERASVELICDNSVMDTIIDRFGEDVTTYANDMTSFRAVVDVATSHVFYSWVFGFGGKVKIKGPQEVKDAYAEMIKTAYNDL